ncbi:MAG: hypothetical protein GWM89_03320 [Candidatus Dadabacteria bacterium]|nr:hypothetical protein [Candidatus Dadabacteria bacterium]NIX14832.1 hypothetical protein [Candidatus Dadabacteria bacterium]NIY21458.1 hypothetical protein [Candidatus Dadabacteria bacterium]
MFNIGDKFRLNLPIIGKKNQFEQGLIAEVTEIVDRDTAKAYRVQFNDGRIAVLPEDILLQSSKPLQE